MTSGNEHRVAGRGAAPPPQRWQLIEGVGRHQAGLRREAGNLGRCDRIRERASGLSVHELETRAIDIRRYEPAPSQVATCGFAQGVTRGSAHGSC